MRWKGQHQQANKQNVVVTGQIENVFDTGGEP